MNTSRSLKRILIGGLVTALVTVSAFAISNDKLTDLRTKAESGNGISQYNLGLVYADPQEPIANIIEAYVWFSLAADNGAPGKALMIVTNQMTPEQLSDGKKLLEQRRADLAAHRPIATAATPVKAADPVKPVSVASPVVAASTEQDVTAIQTELKKATDALAAATKENQQLKADIDRTHQFAIDKLKGERDELAATIAKYTNEISNMRAAAANFEGERNALQQKAADASKQTNGTLAAELAATSAKLKTAENELTKADATLKELTETKQSLASLNEQLQKITGENQRLNSVIKQNENTSDEKLAAAEKTLSETNSELLKAQSKLSDASAKAATAATASAELSTLRQSNGDLSSQVQKLTIERDQALAQASRATTEAQQQIDSLSSKLKASEEAASKTQAENNDLTHQLATLKSAPPAQDPETLAQLTKLSADLQAAQRSAAEEKESLAAKLKATEEASAKVAAENADLAKQVATLKAAPKKDPESKAKLAKLSEDLANAQRVAAEEKETSAAKLKTAEKSLAKVSGERDELEQKLKTTAKPSKKEAAAQAKVEQLKADLEAAQAEAAKAQSSVAELESARRELSDLQSKLKASDEALAQAKMAPAAAPSTTQTEPTVAAATTPEGTTPDLQKELSETQMKLDASLRSYQLQQNEVDRLQNAIANIDNERAQLAERLKTATTEAANSASRASANNDASVQLAGVREQLRQTQNQLASVAYENTEMKHRLAFIAPTPGILTPLPVAVNTVAPNRPGSSKPAVTETPTAAAPRTHTVVSGDTLSTIAKHYYGSASRWTEILAANKGTLRDPAALRVGMKLKIP